MATDITEIMLLSWLIKSLYIIAPFYGYKLGAWIAEIIKNIKNYPKMYEGYSEIGMYVWVPFGADQNFLPVILLPIIYAIAYYLIKIVS